MNVLNYITWYVIIGAIISALIDLSHHLTKRYKTYNPDDALTNYERLAVIFTWPRIVISFIRIIFFKSR